MVWKFIIVSDNIILSQKKLLQNNAFEGCIPYIFKRPSMFLKVI